MPRLDPDQTTAFHSSRQRPYLPAYPFILIIYLLPLYRMQGLGVNKKKRDRIAVDDVVIFRLELFQIVMILDLQQLQ